jgi:DNA-binding MarR family transcriptional regulator
MDHLWTPYTLAEELLKILPNFGRLVASSMREEGEEEATLMQVSVLFQIKEHPITASELAKRRNVSPQSASVLLQSMVERGWLVRIPDPNDRRQSLLQITPEGLARAQAAKDQIASRLARFLVDLTSEEIAAAQVFLPALQRVLMAQMMTADTKDV